MTDEPTERDVEALAVERQAAGLCASCGEKATTTIVLHGRRTLVCLRHFNHWQAPHISLEEAAERIAQARREGATEAWEIAAQRRSEARRYYVAWQSARMRASAALRGDA